MNHLHFHLFDKRYIVPTDKSDEFVDLYKNIVLEKFYLEVLVDFE